MRVLSADELSLVLSFCSLQSLQAVRVAYRAAAASKAGKKQLREAQQRLLRLVVASSIDHHRFRRTRLACVPHGEGLDDGHDDVDEYPYGFVERCSYSVKAARCELVELLTMGSVTTDYEEVVYEGEYVSVDRARSRTFADVLARCSEHGADTVSFMGEFFTGSAMYPGNYNPLYVGPPRRVVTPNTEIAVRMAHSSMNAELQSHVEAVMQENPLLWITQLRKLLPHRDGREPDFHILPAGNRRRDSYAHYRGTDLDIALNITWMVSRRMDLLLGDFDLNHYRVLVGDMLVPYLRAQEAEFKAHVKAVKAELGLRVMSDARWPKIAALLVSRLNLPPDGLRECYHFVCWVDVMVA